jgi:hypothetical protein
MRASHVPFIIGHRYALAQAQPATAAGVGLVALWPGAVRHRMGTGAAMGVYLVGRLTNDKRFFFGGHGASFGACSAHVLRYPPPFVGVPMHAAFLHPGSSQHLSSDELMQRQ